jgi:hypothetical protein
MTSAHHRHDISDHVWKLRNPICPAARAHGAAWPATTGYASMRYFGYDAPGRRGAICHLIMVMGSIGTGAFAAGRTAASGRRLWRNEWMRRIVPGS